MVDYKKTSCCSFNAPGNPAFAVNINIYVSPGGGGNGSAKSPLTLQNAIVMLPDLNAPAGNYNLKSSSSASKTGFKNFILILVLNFWH